MVGRGKAVWDWQDTNRYDAVGRLRLDEIRRRFGVAVYIGENNELP